MNEFVPFMEVLSDCPNLQKLKVKECKILYNILPGVLETIHKLIMENCKHLAYLKLTNRDKDIREDMKNHKFRIRDEVQEKLKNLKEFYLL